MLRTKSALELAVNEEDDILCTAELAYRRCASSDILSNLSKSRVTDQSGN